jgi:SAM-dependent methyltransferase
MQMFEEITRCRICENENLVSVLNLGNQHLTGAFPRTREEEVTCGPLELVKCHAEDQESRVTCGLVQLRQSYNFHEMYGRNYGYRSSLNQSMVRHLRAKVENLQRIAPLRGDDVVLDIGSNDGTLLSFYPEGGVTLVGIDPTAEYFAKYYPPHVHRVSDFFSVENFQSVAVGKKAKIVTSIAMVYDLEQPLQFVQQVSEVLATDGIWHFEQSYLPLMLKQNAYDTVCHEHREYYALKQIQWIIERTDLKIIDVELNDVNGGSFAVTVAKRNSVYRENRSAIDSAARAEREDETLPSFERFRDAVCLHKTKLLALLDRLRSDEATVLGYGASTKGNVILQFCGITPQQLPAIAEVNPDKFGRFTPGTLIPIISEAEAHGRKPDYFLVFPWHFRENLLRREDGFLKAGGKMIFPLPKIEIVSA